MRKKCIKKTRFVNRFSDCEQFCACKFSFKFFWVLFFVLALACSLSCFLSLFSCSLTSFERKVVLEIPKHPWENCSVNAKIWYSLKWSYGNEIKSLYVSPEEKEVEIKIPVGETVFICAFPLGEMQPFGCVITPLDSLSTFELSQDDGFWAAMFLDLDRDVTKGLNYKELKSVIGERLKEVSDQGGNQAGISCRNLDKVVFLRDVYNGELSKSSIEFLSPFTVSPFAVSNGVWISELMLGPCYTVTNSIMPELTLSEGVHRFYNPTTNRELVVVVDDRGNVFRYIRLALV